MHYRAGEDGTQTVAEERNLLSRTVWGYEVGGEGTQGRRLGQTEASENQCGSLPVKSSLSWPTVRRRKANGNRKRGTTVRTGPKRRNTSQEGNTESSRAFPRVSLRGKQSRRKRTQEGNTKTLREVSPVS